MAEFEDDCKAMFKLCVEKCAGKELPEAEKIVCKSNAVNKLLKESFDAKIANAVDATIFCKYQDKATKKLTIDQFMNHVLPDLAKHIIHEKTKKAPSNDDPAVAQELEHLKKKIAAKYHEWMSAEKKGNMAVVDRLTDVKGYTGSHKERFDAETGKGKGMEGRVEVTDNSGYVGNYKGAGTFDKTH